MSHFTFVIPLNRDDLFEAPTRNQYTVENVYSTRDIKIKLSDSLLGVQQQGAGYMLGEGFDIIFSLITEYHKSATNDMKQQGKQRNIINCHKKTEIVYNICTEIFFHAFLQCQLVRFCVTKS